MNSWHLAGTIALLMLAVACKNPHQKVAEETAAKNEQRSRQESMAIEEVRQFVAQKTNMKAETRTSLEVRVIGDWALASDAMGIEFLCRREVSGWKLVSSGTDVSMPADAPSGLKIE